jgi:hypothetical protein
MLLRTLAIKSLGNTPVTASNCLPLLLSICGSVRHQHAKPAVVDDVPDGEVTQHNSSSSFPSLGSSDSRLEIDSWGAVSSIPGQDPVPHLRALSPSGAAVSQGYVNHDGMRVDDGRYTAFLKDAGKGSAFDLY